MKHRILPLLLVLLALTPLASAQEYGTTIDEAWYEKVADAYQDPAWSFDGRQFSIQREYLGAYPGIEFSQGVTSDGTIQRTPVDVLPICILYSTALLAEQKVRSHVQGLGYVVGNEDLKAGVLAIGEAEAVQFQVYTDSGGAPNAVALAGSTRIAPSDAFQPLAGPYGLAAHRFNFDLADLREQGAILNDALTIATGLDPLSRCTFDLTELP